MRKLFTAVLASVFLIVSVVGCAAISSGDKTPAQAVYAAEQHYVVALLVAVKYKKLPPCVEIGPNLPLCSKSSVVTQIQKADEAAYALLSGAQATVRSGGSNLELAVTAAQQAVLAFATITKTLKVN